MPVLVGKGVTVGLVLRLLALVGRGLLVVVVLMVDVFLLLLVLVSD
jgi:hypothetical protein